MRKSGWRLALSATLFVCWIGYLAYLSATTTHPIVLSRSQFLAADIWVIAEVSADPAAREEPAKGVTVKRFMGRWNLVAQGNGQDKSTKPAAVRKLVLSANADDPQGGTIEIDNLSAKHGWEGPGDYILALSKTMEPNHFRLTLIPKTPGYLGDAGRIYPATPTTLRQLELLTEEYGGGKP